MEPLAIDCHIPIPSVIKYVHIIVHLRPAVTIVRSTCLAFFIAINPVASLWFFHTDFLRILIFILSIELDTYARWQNTYRRNNVWLYQLHKLYSYLVQLLACQETSGNIVGREHLKWWVQQQPTCNGLSAERMSKNIKRKLPKPVIDGTWGGISHFILTTRAIGLPWMHAMKRAVESYKLPAAT